MIDREIKVIGFIGLGVMGCSMSKNLLKNKNWTVLVKDLNANKEKELVNQGAKIASDCLLYTSPSPRDGLLSRMPSSA